MKRYFRNRVALAFTILTVFVSIGLWFFMPKNGLLDHAVLIGNFPEWREPPSWSADVPKYDWLTNSDILLYHQNPDQSHSLLRKKVLPPGENSPPQSLPVKPFSNTLSVGLSSDGLTIRLVTRIPPGHPLRVGRNKSISRFISLKDGHMSKEMPGWCLGSWREGDSSVWDIGYWGKLTASVSHYDTGKKEIKILKAISGIKDQDLWCDSIDASGRVITIGDSYYDGIVTPEDKVKLGAKAIPFQTIYDFNLNSPDAPARSWTVPIPLDAAHFQGQIAPTHDKILWRVESNRIPFPYSALQHLPGPLKTKPVYLERWMISDLQGHGMRTIAEFQIDDLYFNRPNMISPKWNPDGKHVSFIFQGGLYLLPVK